MDDEFWDRKRELDQSHRSYSSGDGDDDGKDIE